MHKIGEIVFLFFLMGSAVIDIRRHHLPVVWMAGGSGLVLCLRFLYGWGPLYLWAGGVLAGLGFVLVSRCTQEAFGYGDSWMIVLLGMQTGLWKLITLLSMAFFLSGLWAVGSTAIHKKGRKQTIAFIPFLAAAYMVVKAVW